MKLTVLIKGVFHDNKQKHKKKKFYKEKRFYTDFEFSITQSLKLQLTKGRDALQFNHLYILAFKILLKALINL